MPQNKSHAEFEEEIDTKGRQVTLDILNLVADVLAGKKAICVSTFYYAKNNSQVHMSEAIKSESRFVVYEPKS